jgi:hypothetical protein
LKNGICASTAKSVIPAKAGIQRSKKRCEADKTQVLFHSRGNLFFNWIPAFAGITV